MRVTDQMILENSLSQIRLTQERLLDGQQQASSGIQVAKSSDDPVAFGRIGGLGEQISKLDGYGQNINRMQARLSAVDSTMRSFQTSFTRLRELSLVALNPTGDQTATTEETSQIYTQLLSMANQTFDGEYLFSGYSSSTPFVGSKFVGDNQKRAVEVSPLGATQFGISAQDAFGVTTGQDVFSGVASLLSSMRVGDRTGIQNGLDAIDKYMNQAAQAQTSLGAQLNTLSGADQSNQEYGLQLKSSKSQLQDIDAAAIYSRLANDQHAAEATYSVIGKVSKLSLTNYI